MRDGAGSTKGLLLACAAAGAVLVSLAGCGAEADGTNGLTSAFPRVPNPKDVAAVADRPCALLTPQQAAGFGLDRPPRQLPGMVGKVDCEWRSSRADVWVYISTSSDQLTLEEVYNKRGSLPYFEVTDVRGYPAIVSRTNAKLPACDIDIKTAERQSVTVSYDATAFNNEPLQGCVVGKQVAEAVLMNLPPKG